MYCDDDHAAAKRENYQNLRKQPINQSVIIYKLEALRLNIFAGSKENIVANSEVLIPQAITGLTGFT
jgi:hypothetical protein